VFFRTKSRKRMQLEGAMLSSAEFYDNGRVAVLSVPMMLMERFAATDGNTYYVPLPQNSNGAYGHPDEAGQQQHATIIANAISSVLGW
jgi:hypothetical protein